MQKSFIRSHYRARGQGLVYFVSSLLEVLLLNHVIFVISVRCRIRWTFTSR